MFYFCANLSNFLIQFHLIVNQWCKFSFDVINFHTEILRNKQRNLIVCFFALILIEIKHKFLNEPIFGSNHFFIIANFNFKFR